MDRRDFAKGLAILPFTGTLNSFASISEPEQSQEVSPAENRALQKRNAFAGSFEKFEIVLNGPFALVMSQDAPAKLRAFTPFESHDLHAFFINNTNAKETKKSHVVSLVTEPGALKENRTLPKIDPLLADFNWHSPEKEITSVQNLVEMELPTPDRILADDETITPVRFEDTHLGTTPQGHVLEYTVSDANKLIKMTDSLTGDISLQASPNPGARRITLQVGIFVIAGRVTDLNGVHAKSFHNNDLLTRFQKIKDDKDKRLDTVGDLLALKFYTTTVECKSGGFMVTVP